MPIARTAALATGVHLQQRVRRDAGLGLRRVLRRRTSRLGVGLLPAWKRLCRLRLVLRAAASALIAAATLANASVNATIALAASRRRVQLAVQQLLPARGVGLQPVALLHRPIVVSGGVLRGLPATAAAHAASAYTIAGPAAVPTSINPFPVAAVSATAVGITLAPITVNAATTTPSASCHACRRAVQTTTSSLAVIRSATTATVSAASTSNAVSTLTAAGAEATATTSITATVPSPAAARLCVQQRLHRHALVGFRRLLR